MDILCVGQLVADILVRPVDNIDFTVDTKRVGQIAVNPGGDCLNTAISLAKLGNSTGFCGKVGNDVLGKFLIEIIQNNHIDTSGLKIAEGSETSSVIVLINSTCERIFLYHGGSNDLFCYEDIDTTLLDECRNVHVGGTFLLPRFDGEGAARFLKLAREKGRCTSMDVTYDTSGRWLDIIRPCLPYLNFFMPSYNEAKFITGREHPEEMARFLQDEGVETVVIKLGRDGCYVKGRKCAFYQPAYAVETVDTTGAGDAFVAGFLTGTLKQWSLVKCAQFASAVSAHCIQSLGATTGIPEYDDIVRFIKERGEFI